MSMAHMDILRGECVPKGFIQFPARSLKGAGLSLGVYDTPREVFRPITSTFHYELCITRGEFLTSSQGCG